MRMNGGCVHRPQRRNEKSATHGFVRRRGGALLLPMRGNVLRLQQREGQSPSPTRPAPCCGWDLIRPSGMKHFSGASLHAEQSSALHIAQSAILHFAHRTMLHSACFPMGEGASGTRYMMQMQPECAAQNKTRPAGCVLFSHVFLLYCCASSSSASSSLTSTAPRVSFTMPSLWK